MFFVLSNLNILEKETIRKKDKLNIFVIFRKSFLHLIPNFIQILKNSEDKMQIEMILDPHEYF